MQNVHARIRFISVRSSACEVAVVSPVLKGTRR